jgi:hypothetical protein
MIELTGRRRYRRVLPWSMALPPYVMALEVEYCEFNHNELRWDLKWRWATAEDVERTVGLPDKAR